MLGLTNNLDLIKRGFSDMQKWINVSYLNPGLFLL